MCEQQITLRFGTQLLSAAATPRWVGDRVDGLAVETAGYGEQGLWLVEEAMGHFGCWRAVIAADNFEQAYYAYLELLPEISAAEGYEAYGFDDEATYLDAVVAARDGAKEWPELAEGYAYNDDGGVVCPGDWHIGPLTSSLLHSDRGVQIRIRSDEAAEETHEALYALKCFLQK